MSTTEEKIREVEEEIRKTPKNKSTENALARLKAKMAKLKREQIDRQLRGSGGSHSGYDVKKSGDASAVLIGLPSVGKSTMLNRLTNKESKIGHYAFTTLEAIPGIMVYRDTKIQIIDLPGIISGAATGKGRGKEVLAVARGADLVIVVLDCFDAASHMRIINAELHAVGIRLNREKPIIKIRKTDRGGIAVSSAKRLTQLNEKLVRSIMNEYKLNNATVNIYGDPDVDDLIDVLEGNRVYLHAVYVVNKMDLANEDTEAQLQELMPEGFIPISAQNGVGIEELMAYLIDTMDLIRIYLKPQGGPADFEDPLITPRGSTVGEVCDRLHKQFRRDFKFARVWGDSAKHPGQMVGIAHELKDEDVLSIIKFRR